MKASWLKCMERYGLKVLTTFILVLPTFVNSDTPKRIDRLPGYSSSLFSSNQYHGYLNINRNQTLHYWFVESERGARYDPLILWLSGGPGCSSLFAMFTEIGPFFVSSDGQSLDRNPHAWSKVANLLFLESPIGAGFSYASDPHFVNDDETALEANYAALLEFFKWFPYLKANDFYVAGESYAGVYVPMLVHEILNKKSENNIKLKGMAIGNGVLDREQRTNSFIPFAYYHGFIDETLWDRAKFECCDGSIDDCDLTNTTNDFCKGFVERVNRDSRRLNRYNIYAECPRKNRRRRRSAGPDSLTCRGLDAVNVYLNRQDVREALAINPTQPAFDGCRKKFPYKKMYPDMTEPIQAAVEAGLKILLYYGDLDLVCNFIHGEKFARNLGYEVTVPKFAFEVNMRHAGFYTQYGNLDVAIVHGAGHMVPTDQPVVARYLIENLVNRRNYVKDYPYTIPSSGTPFYGSSGAMLLPPIPRRAKLRKLASRGAETSLTPVAYSRSESRYLISSTILLIITCYYACLSIN